MNFDFDDNLSSSKRKNVNPARFTNLLIIAGFVVLAGLMFFFMNGDKSASLSEADIQATVDTRVTRALENIPNPDTRLATEVPIAMPSPTSIPMKTTQVPDQPIVDTPPIIEGTELINGAMVKGTITDSAFENQYIYQAKAGMPVLILMTADKPFDAPTLILTAPNGDKLVASINLDQAIGNEGQAIIAAIIPSDGTYTITASREGGRAGKQTGNYSLMLEVPPMLEISKPIKDAVASGGNWNWYVYQSTEPFGIFYQQWDGSYLPEVGVYTLNKDKALQGIGYISGDKTSYGQLGWYDSDRLYFIAVGEHASDLQTTAPNKQGLSAGYQIGIMQKPDNKNYQIWCVPSCQG